jgi:hypothetical protein
LLLRLLQLEAELLGEVLRQLVRVELLARGVLPARRVPGLLDELLAHLVPHLGLQHVLAALLHDLLEVLLHLLLLQLLRFIHVDLQLARHAKLHLQRGACGEAERAAKRGVW